MEYFIITGSIVFLAGIIICLVILRRIRSDLYNINEQLEELDTKLENVPFPQNHIADLEKFAIKLKKIVQGLKGIKPGKF